MNKDEYVNHEVRIQLLERIGGKLESYLDKIDEKMNNMESRLNTRMDKIESRMDNQFHWLLGSHLGLILVVLGLLGTVVLHNMKLI